jgi:LacI family transcriptional regulator
VIAGDDELPFDTAVVPRRRGASELVAALCRLGYRSPAVIRPDHDSAAARQWEDGIVETARRLGMRIEYDAVVHAPMTRDGGYDAVKGMPERGPEARTWSSPPPTTSWGTEDVTPALTSVNLALARVGAAAVELALTGPAAGRRRVEFEPRVILRGTTRARHG